MLMPAKVKYRKQQKRRVKGNATRGCFLGFGDYGLQLLGRGWLTTRQIEAGRIAVTRYIQRGGKLWIRLFPDKPITKKPLETRMGKGKGPVTDWVARVQPGVILFEMEGVTEETAQEAFRLASHKLPFPTRFVRREALG